VKPELDSPTWTGGSDVRTRPTEEELAAHREHVRRVIADYAPPTPAREGHRSPRDAGEEALLRGWFRRLFEEGLCGGSWPIEHGGSGDYHPLFDRVVSEEILGARAPRPIDQVQLAATILLRFGTDAQKSSFLPRMRTSEDVWCQLLSEPNAGSDIAGVRVSADQRHDRTFVVNGQKTWITDGHWADMGLALVRTEPGSERHHGLSVLLVPMRAPGVKVHPLVTMGGAAEINEVFFDDVSIPEANLIGRVGEGWQIIMAGLNTERIGMASNTVLLELLIADLLILATTLVVDGQPAIQSTDIRHQIADLSVEAAVTRAFMDDYVERVLDGREGEGDAALAKLGFAECYHRISAFSVDLAASGILGDDPDGMEALLRLQDSWLWSRAYTISAGSSEMMRNIVAKRGLRLPQPSP
jgi:alkylation response protein AidB-like acyl-CoA dehydrogenase